TGCGKSVTVRALLDLLPAPGRRSEGRVVFDGIDLATLDRAQVRTLCGRAVGYVFQDPMTYLNPLLTAGAQVGEAFAGQARHAADATIEDKIVELLRELGIGDPTR